VGFFFLDQPWPFGPLLFRAGSGGWFGRRALQNPGAIDMNGDSRSVCGAVAKLLVFQKTGSGFGSLWDEIGPIVRGIASGRVRAKRGRFGGSDEWAIDDIVQQVAVKLLVLKEPGAKGRFDPARAKPGISGLTGWLWRIVDRERIEWLKKYRGRRNRKLLQLTDLELNDSADEAAPRSFEKFFVAKIERPDLLPILEECIAQLPDPFMREVVLKKLHDESSLRDTADDLAVPATRVFKTLHEAYGLLRPLVLARGIDGGWFDWLAA